MNVFTTLLMIVAAIGAVDKNQQLVARTPHRIVVHQPGEVAKCECGAAFGLTTESIPPRPPTMFFENLGPLQSLPVYTQQLSDESFEMWAKQQNRMARQHVQQRADEWNTRNPVRETYVTEDSLSIPVYNEYRARSVQRVYQSHVPWGGGPLTLINPYVRPK